MVSVSALPSRRQAFAEIFDRKGRVYAVKHGMAIWTDWTQVTNRVNFVFMANMSEWNYVMNMDETDSNFAVPLGK